MHHDDPELGELLRDLFRRDPETVVRIEHAEGATGELETFVHRGRANVVVTVDVEREPDVLGTLARAVSAARSALTAA